MKEELLSQIIGVVIPAVSGGLFFFVIQTLFEKRREYKDRIAKEEIILSIECRHEISRRRGEYPDGSDLEEATALCKKWLKLKRAKMEDKILALRAGYSPESFKKALKAQGRDGLKLEASLRTHAIPSSIKMPSWLG